MGYGATTVIEYCDHRHCVALRQIVHAGIDIVSALTSTTHRGATLSLRAAGRTAGIGPA